MLKLLACVSAVALAYPAAAQVATDVDAGVAADVDAMTEPVETTVDAATEVDTEAEIDADEADEMTVEGETTVESDASVEADAPLPAETPGEKPVQADAAVDTPEADVVAETPAADAAAEVEPNAQAGAQANAPIGADAAADVEPNAQADANAAAQAGSVNSQAEVTAFVDQQFGNYDGDADGELTAEEFAEWMIPLQQQQGNHTEAELNLWAQGAFDMADADDSESVSAAEMTAFLAG